MSKPVVGTCTVIATARSIEAIPSLENDMPNNVALVRLVSDGSNTEHARWPERPTVILVTPHDLIGPQAERLATIQRSSSLIKMVLFGGTQDKDTLIRSINVWRVARVIPAITRASEVWEILSAVRESTALSTAVEQTAQRLSDENKELENAIEQLNHAQKQLLHTERLSTVGRLARGLVTSIQQHLTGLDEFSRVAASSCNDETREFMDLTFDATRSVSALLNEMHGYADSTPSHSTASAVALNDLVARAVSLTRFDTELKRRQVKLELGLEQTVFVEQFRLYQVLLNLLRNAAQATDAGARITIRTYRSHGSAVVEVEDEGCGMPEAVRARIFDPFFSTKGTGGMGLGLHLCKLAVERQAGNIECISELDRGTLFRISLPARMSRAVSA